MLFSSLLLLLALPVLVLACPSTVPQLSGSYFEWPGDWNGCGSPTTIGPWMTDKPGAGTNDLVWSPELTVYAGTTVTFKLTRFVGSHNELLSFGLTTTTFTGGAHWQGAENIGLTPLSDSTSSCMTSNNGVNYIPVNMYQPTATYTNNGLLQYTFSPPKTCILTWNVPMNSTKEYYYFIVSYLQGAFYSSNPIRIRISPPTPPPPPPPPTPTYYAEQARGEMNWDSTWKVTLNGSMLLTFTASAESYLILGLTNDMNPVTSWQITLGGWTGGQGKNGPRSGIMKGIQGQLMQLSAPYTQPCNITGQSYWLILSNNILSIGTGEIGSSPIFDRIDLTVLAGDNFPGNQANRLGLSGWYAPVNYTNIVMTTVPSNATWYSAYSTPLVKPSTSYISDSMFSNFEWNPAWSTPTPGLLFLTFTAYAESNLMIGLSSDTKPTPHTTQAWQINLGYVSFGDIYNFISQGIEGSELTYTQSDQQPCNITGQNYWLLLVNNTLSAGVGEMVGSNPLFDQVILADGFAANQAMRVGLSSFNNRITYSNIQVTTYPRPTPMPTTPSPTTQTPTTQAPTTTLAPSPNSNSTSGPGSSNSSDPTPTPGPSSSSSSSSSSFSSSSSPSPSSSSSTADFRANSSSTGLHANLAPERFTVELSVAGLITVMMIMLFQ